MTKTTKILLVVLVIIIVGTITYFFYNKYRINNDLNNNLQTEDDWNNYNEQLLAKSVFGVIKDVGQESITVVDNENNEFTYKISEVTLVEKLGPVEQDGSQSFQETDVNELKKDKSVWIILDSADNTLAMTIKLTNTDANSTVSPTPTQ